ncbi:unnamed protein product [Polarella glacialis]|uniref:Uncharacterized protein n=1 Tax=Polarella glacialis TaxID=89957 RepID=A0A813DIW1_POLGL|nr:unnamed protein product [Polarella glacialis]CAE8732177.1 unnamed protein product [Polarella glacialis]
MSSQRGSAGSRSQAVQRHSTASRLLLAACSGLVVVRCVHCDAAELLQCWSGPAGRRGILAAAATAVLGAAGAPSAEAFPNAVTILKRDMNDPKKLGLKPADLGLQDRGYMYRMVTRENQFENLETAATTGTLKECGNQPNCFSTTWDERVDKGLHDLQPWKFSGKTPEEAIKEIGEVIRAYPVGQLAADPPDKKGKQIGIDAGGFKIIQDTPRGIEIEFESLKRGHRDDVEFYISPGTAADAKEGELLVRSSSRQGNYDYGVNAGRLNRISADLQAKGGWTTFKIDAQSHPRYWSQNCPAGDYRKAPFSVRKTFPEECKKYPYDDRDE